MRELVFDALANDAELDLGPEHVFTNYSLNGDNPTPRDHPFLIIRFEEQTIKNETIARGPEVVTVWAHRPLEIGPDYAALRDQLAVVREVMESLRGSKGFGYEITSVKFNGLGGDFKDIGYNTYTKNSGFEILSHPVG